jgi:hypothetical protein
MILRDVDVYNSSLFGGNFFLEDAITLGTIWAFGLSTLIGESAQWRGRQVFSEGQGFTFRADAPVDLRASGYLLEA